MIPSLLATDTCCLDHRSLVVSPPPSIVPNYTENQDCTCHQHSVVHVSGINRHLRWPEIEKQNDKHIYDGEQIDHRPQHARDMPSAPAELESRRVCEL